MQNSQNDRSFFYNNEKVLLTWDIFCRFRSRRRSGSGVTDIHSQQQQQQLQLQENNNSSSRDAKKPQEGLGPDEMWAPDALSHHRELPVDVPDTLLQKAYPNKVTNRSSDYRNGLQHRPRSASDLDLSLNLKNETLLKTRTIADERATRLASDDRVRDVTDASGTPISVRNGLQSILKIELKIEDEGEKVRARREIATDSPDLKSALRAFALAGHVDEDAGGQRESSVDVEDDYPFAKEDYPTMLKTCSDDSASPRSSSGRSDSTAPLDTSLMLRHGKHHKDSPTYDVRRIDLGSPCRSVVPDIKVAPLFGRNRDATSFDNPAYGLTDLQDLQGLLRTEEVSDLTRLIDEQRPVTRIPKDQDKIPAVRAKDQQTESAPTAESASKSGKSPKRRPNDERAKLKAKTRSLDIEELIRAASTDDLLGGVELSNLSSSSSSSRQRPKKKRHQQTITNGYSTLRSEASGDLEQGADRSFLVVGGSYREVAVDCPPDFVPITKCHPVYPPPNKTPSNSKHNTLEPRHDRDSVVSEGSACAAATSTTSTTGTTALVASPCLSPNDSSLTTSSSGEGSAREIAVARTVDRKHNSKKVRSRIKSLILDGFQTVMHHEHRRSLRLSSTHPLNALTQLQPNEPALRDFDNTAEELHELRTLSSSAHDVRDGGRLFYENFRFDTSRGDVDRDVPLRRKFLGNVQRPFSSVLREELPENWRNSFLAESKDGRTASSTFFKAIDDSARSTLSHSVPANETVNSSASFSDSRKQEIASCNCPNRSAIEHERNISSVSDASTLPIDDVPVLGIARDTHYRVLPSFVQETNQNSRNSLREHTSTRRQIVHHPFDDAYNFDDFRSRYKERCDNLPCPLDYSVINENETNSRLFMEYKYFKLLNDLFTLSNNSRKSHIGPFSRSMFDLSDLPTARSTFQVRNRSQSDSVSVRGISFSRRIKGRNRPTELATLNDSLPVECTKRGTPRPPIPTLENHSCVDSQIGALGNQVNRSGLWLLIFRSSSDSSGVLVLCTLQLCTFHKDSSEDVVYCLRLFD